MICVHCEKKIEKPLILFDGEMTCPHCKKSLTKVEKFRITVENEELYRLSENLFFRALTDGDKSKQRERMASAFSYCTQAAVLGNPYAIVRLGYYYEKGLSDSFKRDSDCWRIAYGFYSSVCYCEAEVSVEPSLKARYSGGDYFEQLQKTAASYLLDMLLTSDDEFDSIKRFNYKENRAKLQKTLGISFAKERPAKKKQDRIEKIFGMLDECLNKLRPTSFGFFFATKEEINRLFAEGLEVTANAKSYVDKGVRFSYVPSQKRRVDEDGDVRFITMSTSMEIDARLNDEDFSDEGYLFFVNGNKQGKTQLDVEKLSKALNADSGNLKKQLINLSGMSSLAFYEDDILQYLSGKNYASALQKLVNALKEKTNDV